MLLVNVVLKLTIIINFSFAKWRWQFGFAVTSVVSRMHWKKSDQDWTTRWVTATVQTATVLITAVEITTINS
jgi:hypothetical protein